MAEVRIAIAKTPSQADKLGRTIYDTVKLSESEARKLRDFYRASGNADDVMFNAFVSAMVGVITGSIATKLAVPIATATGAFTSLTFKSYYTQLANKFDMITNDNPKDCKLTYQYKRLASNDGYYWLKDIKVL